MIERGIHNTKADFWAHLHPKDAAVYWYLVRNMRDWLADKKPISTLGSSKDGVKTGAGYLVPKTAPFVQRAAVPAPMIAHFKWEEGTDREVGLLWGETVMDWMANAGLLRIPFFSATRLTAKQDQYSLGDFGIQFSMPRVQLVEVKTEMKESGNLFVQTHERGHRVHQVKRNDAVIIRKTEAPGLL